MVEFLFMSSEDHKEMQSMLIYTQANKLDSYQLAAEELGYRFELVGKPGETAPYFFESKIRRVQPNERLIKVEGIVGSQQPFLNLVDSLFTAKEFNRNIGVGNDDTNGGCDE